MSISIRKRKLSPEFMKAIIDAYEIKSADDIGLGLTTMFDDAVEAVLQTEINAELNSGRNDMPNKKSLYIRKGFSFITSKPEYAEAQIDLSHSQNRHRTTPIHQQVNQGLENKIVSLFANGTSVKDISEHIKSLYDFEDSAVFSFKINDKTNPSQK